MFAVVWLVASLSPSAFSIACIVSIRGCAIRPQNILRIVFKGIPLFWDNSICEILFFFIYAFISSIFIIKLYFKSVEKYIIFK